MRLIEFYRVFNEQLSPKKHSQSRGCCPETERKEKKNEKNGVRYPPFRFDDTQPALKKNRSGCTHFYRVFRGEENSVASERNAVAMATAVGPGN